MPTDTIVGRKRVVKHGMVHTRFYQTWLGMKSRCGHRKAYLKVSVSKDWEKFENFRDDMYKSYLKHVAKHGEKETTLDRVNVKGNYNKKNCKWATWKEQNRNRTNNVMYKGETAQDASLRITKGVSNNLVCRRYTNYGWTLKRAFTEPLVFVRKSKKSLLEQ